MRLHRIFILLFMALAGLGIFIRSDLGTRTLLAFAPQLPVTYSSIRGSLFSGVTLDDVRLEVPGGALTFDHLEVELSALRLLRRQIFLNRCVGDGLTWVPGPDAVPLVNGGRPEPLPFAVAIPSFTFTRVRINALAFDATGALRLGKRFERAYARIDATGDFGAAKLQASLRDHHVKLRLQHDENTLIARGSLPAFIDLKTPHGPKAPGRLQAHLRTPYGKASARRDLHRSWTLLASSPLAQTELKFKGTLQEGHLSLSSQMGTLEGTLLLDLPQSLSARLTGRSLYFEHIRAAEVSAAIDLHDLLNAPTGSIHANATRATVGPYDFASVQFDANSSDHVWPFSLSATGAPLSFDLQGEDRTLVYLSGTFHDRPLELLQPAHFTATALEDIRLRVGTGILSGTLTRTSFDLTLDNIEQVSGTAQYNWQTHDGACNLTFPQGALNASLGSNTSGSLTYSGRIEEHLDLLNIGPHRFEGQATVDLNWRGPLVSGTATLADGRYENYRTGTELLSLNATLTARGHTFELTHLSATDNSCQGTLTGTGSLALSPFAFNLDTAFQNFTLAQISWADARADGDLHLTGDLSAASVTGALRIDDANLIIPDTVASPLPDLPVHYLHATRPAPAPHIPSSTYPIHLDIRIQAPHNVTVSGRGLTSTWEGDLILRGDLDALQATGACTLATGELVFSGRVFKLSHGTLTFNNSATPTLKLSGSRLEKGVTLTANLEGPLNRPRLTFQSSPPLPQSTLFAYLLFGEDISELTAFQAVQLASTLTALATGGPDILDTTRRSLGVDRLRVITAPSSRPGEETLALQVGKYIADGVIITLTQSADNSSPSIAVEVDLHKGFYFEAENDNVQEQGRFSLKWNKNY